MALSVKQAEKLKSHKIKEGWMKNDEEWWFQAVEGFDYGQTDRQTNGRTFVNVDRFTFAMEKSDILKDLFKDFTFEIEVGLDILDYIFTPLVHFNYNFCRYMLLEIIRIAALVLSTTIFQIYSLVLPLSVFMKLLFLSFICFLKSFVSAFLIWFQPSLEVIFSF